ncbi:restriction endonuclease subunit S [Lactobacillus crispatus]|uniref:restriction endonuclease subunit S n=1 Tax=Lactobacillus crispatus TaxID=47770 RepID=UPI000C7DE1C6|nr:restriction endonuclease subunit S [Lactobacillus crispatus]PLA30085.1 restriction endonuclease subunit S [Lactobacillus crispatus]
MTKNDDKCVPALRFKGFNNDWAQRMLGEISIVNSGKDYKQLNKGNIPVYGTGGYMLSVDQYLSKNDAVGIGRKGTIDHPQYLKAPFWTVDTLFFMTVRENNNLHYLYSLFQKINWKKYDESTGLPSLSKKTINNISVKVPEYIEQKRIGNFISQVDSLLSLQQRKAKQLKLLKKAMLQDLFTDKNVPKLRFNGFDANWIQCKLEKEALLTMGQSPSGSTYSDQPSTYILVQGNADLKNGWVKPRIWTTQITKLAKKGDIIITVRAPAGKVGRTNFDVVLGRGVASIQGNDFIFYLLSKMDMNKYWKKYAAGSTFESINSNDIKNTRVHVPNLPEQNRIANLFLRLDDLIRFQQNKLNNLQKTKQFLLQNMFI